MSDKTRTDHPAAAGRGEGGIPEGRGAPGNHDDLKKAAESAGRMAKQLGATAARTGPATAGTKAARAAAKWILN